MNRDDLRITKKSSEIMANLVRYSMKEGHGVLWQNLSHGRHVFSVRLKNVIVENRMVAFELSQELSTSNGPNHCLNTDLLDPTDMLYFKGEGQSMLFKAEAGTFFANGDMIYVPIPKVAYFPELRANPRYAPKEDLAVGLRKFNRGQGHQQVDLQCRNFSRGGFGLTLSYVNAHLFKKSQRIFICSLGAQELPSPIEGAVAYIRKFHEEKEKRFSEFKIKYREELEQKEDAVQAACTSGKPITLVTSVKDIAHSHIPLLKELFEKNSA